MKKIFIVLLLTIYSYIAFASHITGGEMIYEYLGPGSQINTRTYRITLKLFRDENTTGAPMPASVFIGIFNNDNNSQFPANNQPFPVSINSNDEAVKINPYPPCVKNAPPLDYHVGMYSLTIELPNNTKGYTAAYQTCCRVAPLNNIFINGSTGGGGTGSTYGCIIPPLIDSSPTFASSIDLICYNRDFTLNFSAADVDGDSLVYSFVEAYNGGNTQNANNVNPAPPPYSSVSYLSGFSATTPLGDLAAINPLTGVITGIAPLPGKYVVSVSVKSYRNTKYVGEHRKDFIVNVGDCDVPGAELLPKPVVCDELSVTFSNDNPSPQNQTFFWDFGDPKSGILNTSTMAAPLHQFSDSGVFVYKLVVNRGLPCSDSTTQIIKVYPGFSPGFTYAGNCKSTPIQFTDTSKSRYGTVDSWAWNFGDTQSTSDSSHLPNPSYLYTATNNYNAQLTVTDTKGCVGTATVTVVINDKPDFSITTDTLICTIDTLQLNATGTGTFFWTPAYNINNQNIASPLVSPDLPTKYYANFSDIYGCKGTDSVFVNVKSSVTLDAGSDTTICTTDTLLLAPLSDALKYEWSPANTLNNSSLKNPTATPLNTTIYSVTASIGKCQSTDAIIVKAVPYPFADAGDDSTICIGTSIQLSASGGSLYNWSPAFFLDNPNIAAPVANPINDIRYTVTVSDTSGCPKPVSDAIFIRVLSMVADAGPADTSVVINQPLQLNASGGEFYLWTPPVGLTNPNISNPIANLSNSQQYVVTVRQAGCFDTDTINITVYKVASGLYVPNAFTPDNDGRNDVLRPIPIGMKTLSYFRVYDRWGKLVFSSSKLAKGWDGMFQGKPQTAGVYVWIAEGIDYLNKKVTKKGSVVLIR
ncbi:MAG: PKD domain-containing protein [Ginsengibacter sp.]